jgi:hypothetical protein
MLSLKARKDEALSRSELVKLPAVAQRAAFTRAVPEAPAPSRIQPNQFRTSKITGSNHDVGSIKNLVLDGGVGFDLAAAISTPHHQPNLGSRGVAEPHQRPR